CSTPSAHPTRRLWRPRRPLRRGCRRSLRPRPPSRPAPTRWGVRLGLREVADQQARLHCERATPRIQAGRPTHPSPPLSTGTKRGGLADADCGMPGPMTTPPSDLIFNPGRAWHDLTALEGAADDLAAHLPIAEPITGTAATLAEVAL